MPYITINLDTMEYRHSVGIPSEISTNEFYFEISEKEIEKANNKIKKSKWDSSRCLNFLLKCFYSRLDTTYNVAHNLLKWLDKISQKLKMVILI